MKETSEKSDDMSKVCSREDLDSLSKKKNRILFISSDEDKIEFSQKFANTVKSSDLEVIRYQTGSSCDVVKDLGLEDKPAAVLLENGEVKDRITLTNNDIKDTADLSKMIYKKQDSLTCKANFVVNEKGWSLSPESSEQCNKTISKIEKQGPATKKYLKKHIK